MIKKVEHTTPSHLKPEVLVPKGPAADFQALVPKVKTATENINLNPGHPAFSNGTPGGAADKIAKVAAPILRR